MKALPHHGENKISEDDINNSTDAFYLVQADTDANAPKILNCPSTIQKSTEGETQTAVFSWNEPFVVNFPAMANVSSTHKPNEIFPIGSTLVAYTFENGNGNKLFCNFTVLVLNHTNSKVYLCLNFCLKPEKY